ncbi:hypothetical protein FRC11_009179 [Ceratobasidium sp. 423]|nr:hypothetical protein FRC11_009179 [Ceratobasidium sp. 423]
MSNPTHRRSLMGYILRPVAWQLALASRLAMPPTNKSITYSNISRCIQPRFILDFRSDEGQANVQKWYQSQGSNTRFTLLEYRKVKHGSIRHEFIVVWFNSTTLCRFDRRARDGERGHVLRDEGAPAEDSVHVLSSFDVEYKELLEQTEVLLSIKLPRGEDLGIILCVCEGIQTHPKASSYNLMQYNCYFYSWTLVAAVARRTYNWETNVLSKDGWDDVIRTSLGPIFRNLKQYKEKCPDMAHRAAVGRLFTTIFVGRLPRLQNNARFLGVSSHPEVFRDVLSSQFTNSYDTIKKVLSNLLLRSQLGPVLRQELHRIEGHNLFSAKCIATEKMVLSKCVKVGRFNYEEGYNSYTLLKLPSAPQTITFRLEQLHAATYAAAEVLSAKGDPEDKSMSNSWETAWRAAWGEYISFRPWNGKTIHPSALGLTTVMNGYNPATQGESRSLKSSFSWEALTRCILNEWKSGWDEYDRLSAHCIRTITPTIATTIQKRLNDMAPEQLVFGSGPKQSSSSDQPENPSSLQDFIRNRMQEHFEMVDRFGFGSFQSLITTAEEAMCEIWVTSLNIIESGRYQPSYIGIGQTTPQK